MASPANRHGKIPHGGCAEFHWRQGVTDLLFQDARAKKETSIHEGCTAVLYMALILGNAWPGRRGEGGGGLRGLANLAKRPQGSQGSQNRCPAEYMPMPPTAPGGGKCLRSVQYCT